MNNYVPFIGRILIAQIFLVSGLTKILDPVGTQQYMAKFGMPFTGLLMVGAILFEIGGSLSVLLGYKARWGAIALLVFLVPTTLIFHTNFADSTQMVMFMKNLAIMGGLLMLAYSGPGEIRVGARAAAPAGVAEESLEKQDKEK